MDGSWYRQDRMTLATGLLTVASHGMSRNLDHPVNTRQAFLGTEPGREAGQSRALGIPACSCATWPAEGNIRSVTGVMTKGSP